MDNNSFGITMIGLQGSGKTCYLYAMYAKMAFGVNGFTFMPVDYDKSLDLEEGWNQIVTNRKWPPGNVESFDYEFQCSYALRPLIGFMWHDYRGGLLKERTEEREMLFNHLQSSSVLILCISAETVLAIVDNNSDADSELRIYNLVLNDFRRKRNQTVPVAITIMKADLISKDVLAKGIEIIRERCLSTLFKPDEPWLIMFTWVSLGSNLANTDDDKISGCIQPTNIHVPVMFGIYSVFNRALSEIKTSRKDLHGNLNTAESTLGSEEAKNVFQKFLRRGRRESLDSQVGELKRQLGEMNQNFSKLEADLHRVVQELNDEVCRVFWGGEEMDIRTGN